MSPPRHRQGSARPDATFLRFSPRTSRPVQTALPAHPRCPLQSVARSIGCEPGRPRHDFLRFPCIPAGPPPLRFLHLPRGATGATGPEMARVRGNPRTRPGRLPRTRNSARVRAVPRARPRGGRLVVLYSPNVINRNPAGRGRKRARTRIRGCLHLVKRVYLLGQRS